MVSQKKLLPDKGVAPRKGKPRKAPGKTASKKSPVGDKPKTTPKGDGLNARQVRFVDEYMIDLNAAQAAIRAGYSVKTARQIGYENLIRPDIAAAVEAKRKELAVSRGITRERILDEMAKLAFSDLRGLFREDGTLKPPHEWPDGAAGAVSSLEVVETTKAEVDGEGGVKYTPEATKKLKLWDKGKQLENLLKHLGMDEDKPAEHVAAASALDAMDARLDKLLAQPARG